jgi:hypothetical protein
MKKINLTRIAAAVSTLLAISVLTEAQATTFTIGNYDPLFQGIDETTATIQGGSGVSQALIRVDAPPRPRTRRTSKASPSPTARSSLRTRQAMRVCC